MSGTSNNKKNTVIIDTQHIIAYLNGELSSSEQKKFECQLETSTELQKEVDDMKFILQLSTELRYHRKIDVERNWKQVSRKIKLHTYRLNLIRHLRNAAAILIIPLLTFTAILLFQLNEVNNREAEIIEVSSVPGTISKINLPDGSLVWLNSGSILRYPKYFKGGSRQVTLEGEAYFKVNADKNNKFDVILLGHLIVSAYGTEFNINAYTDNRSIQTTLVNGRIAVEKLNSTESRILEPAQKLVYSRENGSFEMKPVILSVSTGWKDGKMVFRRADMAEITERLSRKFNVDIILEGEELYDYRYSATFTDETLPEILSLLEKSAPIKCRIIEPKQSADYSFTRKTVIITVQKKK